MKKIAAVLAVFVTLPIWYFLLYHILDRVNASELAWFLYWIYMPVTVFVSVLTKLAED